MAIQIKLHTFVEQGEKPTTHWKDAKGTPIYPLEICLKHFWVAVQPEFADGPAIEIRFV